MDAVSTGDFLMPEQGDTAVAESRRWLRDLGALLALPAMWVDHEPMEIATGLLSVLCSVLRLDGAYVRFDDPQDGGRALESWRPSGPRVPFELTSALDAVRGPREPGLTTLEVDAHELGVFRVTFLPLALPWETGLILVSSNRGDFPTAMETHLLRVAVSQAAIAIHTARRLAHEHAARAVAEAALLRQSELLRSLVEDTHASLESISRRIRDAARFVADAESSAPPRPTAERAIPKVPSDRTDAAHARSPLLHLTRREIETLGLLAQGLSNKEIAGLMWLSDRTVERHVTSLYRKIGVARRSEATAFALRHGFV